MTPAPPPLGVVVPTLDEADRLPFLLDDLGRLSVAHTTVVADGGSTDGTREVARRRGARVVEAPRGRGVQLNAGARAAGETPWLLFLHADVRLSPDAGDALASWLEEGGAERAGFFRFGLEGDDWFWRFLELGQRLRERLYGLAYGDQGLVVSRDLFDAVGGYPEIPLMEDVEILRRLRRRVPVERLPATLRASPRRYEREGRWYGWLRNAALVSLYLAGVRPERLAAWYRPRT
ncbi:MAG TPA: TIGR04283 family arsenosugar biosynthesis glycosyltransferase, partial [Longimicrobiales bacterium]|nr:TIGR04283 family arsenosugar biosynthesis glycosyltransferase [Longimicrobiales bacterium]